MARPSSDSQTEAGQTDHEPAGACGPDRVDAINQLFAEFEIAYHNQYYKAYSNDERLVLAKKYWLSCLAGYAPAQIVAAARYVVKSHDFLPTISVVVRACEDGASVFGLPSAREAYIEACRAPSPKSGAKWSHEAVYFAGKSTGWFFLASEPEDKVYPLFQYYYHALCQRVMRGEALATPQPPALSEHISKPLSAQENQARMKKMREDLGL